MRKMASHPAQKGCFEIRRAAITPPDTLLKLIWPELDQWKGKFGMQGIDDLAANGFCNLLHQLRMVILQGSVPLRQAFPDHPIWAHRVFNHQDYTPLQRKWQNWYPKTVRRALARVSPKLCQILPTSYTRLVAR
jgi:hypothetical protein